jgi:hypothetical protein
MKLKYFSDFVNKENLVKAVFLFMIRRSSKVGKKENE